jgi:uncharacterized membrane protein AbrB (regulator of aidB expression)
MKTKKTTEMKNLRYPIFYFIWSLLFYAVFSIQQASCVISEWPEIERMHYVFYGPVIGLVLTVFYYIDNNFEA